jgi:hypothetical protein
LPVGFAAILLGIKVALDTGGSLEKVTVPALIQNDTNAMIILSFSDYVTALLAQRVCVLAEDGTLEISGMPNRGADWQVPFVKCDVRQCTAPGQEAYDFCEYQILAVAPSSSGDVGGRERAEAFTAYVNERYPLLKDTNKTHFPGGYDFVQLFDSNDAIDEYVTNPAYGTSGSEKIGLAVVFEGNDQDDFKYSLRVNSTNFNNPVDAAQPAAPTTPDTTVITASYANEDTVCYTPEAPPQGAFSESCTGLYIYNGLLTTQRLVHDWILTEATDGAVFVSEHGVRCK